MESNAVSCVIQFRQFQAREIRVDFKTICQVICVSNCCCCYITNPKKNRKPIVRFHRFCVLSNEFLNSKKMIRKERSIGMLEIYKLI